MNLDPDPLHTWTYDAVEWWDEGYRRGRRARRSTLTAAVLLGIAIGCASTILIGRVSAAPRSESAPSIPVAALARTEASPIWTGPDDPRQPVPASVVGAGVPYPAETPVAGDASLSGTASWYPASGLIAAAGPGLRTGHWRGRSLVVSANGRTVTVRLSDWCQCYGTRLLDLSDDAFARLAPLSRGLVRVSVSSVGPAPTPPATDIQPVDPHLEGTR